MSRLLMALSTSRRGGAERIVHDLARKFSNDHAVDIAYLKDRPAGAPGWFSLLFGKYDVVHSHLFMPGLVARVRRIWDARFVWIHTVHYADYVGQRGGRTKRFIDHWIFSAPDALVAVSETVFESIAHFENAVTIRNAVSFSNPAQPARAPTGGPVIGTISMLRKEKGLDDLIAAFALFHRVSPDARLLIAGTGPEEMSLRSLADRLNIASAVEWKGFVEDKDAFLASLDVYVQPSHSESFGLAVIEAMAAGVPVVTSAVGHLPLLLNRGDFGELVPRGPKFAEYLAGAIDRVLLSAEAGVEKSRAGASYWKSQLSFDRMAGEYRALYHRFRSPGVCMIAPIVTQSTGGLQRQLYLQSRELAERGFNVYVLQRRDREILKPGPLREKWSHVRFLMPSSPTLGARLSGLWFAVAAFGLIFRFRNRIRLIHAHQLYSPTLAGALAKWCFGQRLVVKVTASGMLGEARELKRLPFYEFRRRFFRAVDAVIVLNEEMRQEMRDLGFDPAKIHLIPNGVVCTPVTIDSTTAFAAAAAPKTYRLLYCGRLSKEKSLETLIAAGELLLAKGYKIEIHFVGGGDPDRDTTKELKDLSEKLGVAVRFHGVQSDVTKYYQSADAFILPSLSEGLSNALLEALASGLVCVASDIPPNRFVIEDGVSGVLFRAGKARDLAGKLELLIKDGQNSGDWIRSLRTAAADRARQVFSTEAVGAEIGRLYGDLGVSP